jgi:L-amino acid N-acyltransferase YncA
MTVTSTVRPAAAVDAGAIAEIYSEGIADRVATFETSPRSAVDVLVELRKRRAGGYPALVVETEGAVQAFAWASAYSARDCYRGIAEFSVYVRRGVRGHGYGRAALAGLVAACQAEGTWKLVSRIFPENAASLALCRGLGFREVGTYRRHARLDGRWRDCVVVELLLGAALDP